MGRRAAVLLLFLSIWLTSSSVHTQQFEGIIDIKLSTPAFDEDGGMESVVQRFYIKQPNIRIEVEGSMSEVVVLVDNSKREMHVLDRGLKRYTTNTFDEYTDEEDQHGSPVEFEMKSTERSTTLLGYHAELIEFTALGDIRESFDRIEVWVTDQLGSLLGDLLIGMLGNEAAQSSWQAALIDQQLFPLKTRTFQDTYLLEETEVVHIERRVLAESLFEIPQEYRHVDLRK